MTAPMGFPVAAIADPDDSRHGTETGYAAHRRAGVPQCDACRAANSAATQARKARRAADVAAGFTITADPTPSPTELLDGRWVRGRHGVARWVPETDDRAVS